MYPGGGDIGSFESLPTQIQMLSRRSLAVALAVLLQLSEGQMMSVKIPDAGKLDSELLRLRDGFAAFVEAIDAHAAMENRRPQPSQKRDPYPEFIIEAKMKIFAKRSQFFGDPRTPERTLLADRIRHEPIDFGGKGSGELGPLPAIGFDEHRPPADPLDAFSKLLGCRLKRTRLQQIVAVDKSVERPGCPGESFVERIGLALIALARPPGKSILIFFNDLHGAIAAPAVADHVFQVRIVLIENRMDRLLKIGSLIEAWSDYSDPGQIHRETGGSRARRFGGSRNSIFD